MKFLLVTILQVVEFGIFLLIFAWTLQQRDCAACDSNELRVAAHYWPSHPRVYTFTIPVRASTYIQTFHGLGRRVLTVGSSYTWFGSTVDPHFIPSQLGNRLTNLNKIWNR